MVGDEFKVCPFCKEKIRKEAVKCRFCGEWLEQVSRREAVSSQTFVPSEPSQSPLPTKPDDGPTIPAEDKKDALPRKPQGTVSSKALTMVSIGLLAFCSVVVITCLKDANFGQGQEQKLIEAFLRILICAGIFGWIVWGVAGKRKGYGLVSFSAGCAIAVIIFAYYFQDSRQKTQQRLKKANELFVANIFSLQEFIKQGAVGDVPAFRLTGDADFDALLQNFTEFYREYFQEYRTVNLKLESLQERNVFDDLVISNKSSLNGEIQKRIAGQQIIQQFEESALPMFENFQKKCESLNTSDEFKRGVLKSLKKMTPRYKVMFDLWLRAQKADQDFLQFMFGAFEDYQLTDGKIVFSSPTNSQKYSELAKSVQDAEAELQEFEKQRLATLEAQTTELQRLGK